MLGKSVKMMCQTTMDNMYKIEYMVVDGVLAMFVCF